MRIFFWVEHNVNTEIDRYISWPGQALSYKLGEIKIKELRQKAETELGEDFDVREFHHAILEYGSVPLAVLEKNIERFIQQKKTALNLPNASAGMLRTLRDFRSDFVADRNVHIWLPEQYHSMASQGQEFAVVYMHDGQMLFDELFIEAKKRGCKLVKWQVLDWNEPAINFYKKYGIRYNAPLLDLGINKNEERRIMKEHDIEPGWGKRRSHQGFQPICAIGFQHTLDILFDWHTTYPPDRVEEFLSEKTKIMDTIIRRELINRGHDPDALIARNIEQYNREEARIQAKREEYRQKMKDRLEENPV